MNKLANEYKAGLMGPGHAKKLSDTPEPTDFWADVLENNEDAESSREALGTNNANNLTEGTIPNARYRASLQDTTSTNQNANILSATGWYYLASDADNIPITGTPFYIRVIKGPGGTITQDAFAADSNRHFTRRLWSSGEGWRDWVEETGIWYPVTDWTNVSGNPTTLTWTGLTQGQYELQIEGIAPAVDNDVLNMQCRNASTQEWYDSAYNYGYTYIGPNQDGHQGSGSDGYSASIRLSRAAGPGTGIGNLNGGGYQGVIRFNPGNAFVRNFLIQGAYVLPGGNVVSMLGSGNVGTSMPIDAIRLYFSSSPGATFKNTGRTRLLKMRDS